MSHGRTKVPRVAGECSSRLVLTVPGEPFARDGSIERRYRVIDETAKSTARFDLSQAR